MIAQVDEALCRLLAPHLPAGTEIRLDPPKPTWQTEAQVRSVELFLFALQNARNTDSPAGGRDAGAGQVGGPATGVTPRAGGLNRRRCILSYLVTARAGLVRDEHALLDAALHAVTAADEIPKTFLPAHSNGCLPVEIAISDAEPAPCAVLLTTASLKQESHPQNATPEDFKLHDLRTSGTASGTNRIITYVSLKTGLIVRATEEAHQQMDVTVTKADGSNRVRYAVNAKSRSEIVLVSETPLTHP